LPSQFKIGIQNSAYREPLQTKAVLHYVDQPFLLLVQKKEILKDVIGNNIYRLKMLPLHDQIKTNTKNNS